MPEDFTLRIKNVPRDIKHTEADLAAWLKKSFKDVSPKKILLPRRLFNQVYIQGNAYFNICKSCMQKKNEIKEDLARHNQIWGFKDLEHTNVAYVTFDTIAEKKRVQEELKLTFCGSVYLKCGCACGCENGDNMYQRQLLYSKNAQNPEDIIWENLDPNYDALKQKLEDNKQKGWYDILFLLASFMIGGANFGIIAALS